MYVHTPTVFALVLLASFQGLSRFYVRLVHAKHEREEKFE